MPFRLLDDAPPADVGFVASGRTLEECFRAASDAVLACMLANPESLRLRERRSLRAQTEAVDIALVQLLEELIFYKDAESLFLRATHVRVTRDDRGCSVEAVLEGEEIDPARHECTGDVKAVTMHRLGVQRTECGWEATVVLDV